MTVYYIVYKCTAYRMEFIVYCNRRNNRYCTQYAFGQCNTINIQGVLYSQRGRTQAILTTATVSHGRHGTRKDASRAASTGAGWIEVRRLVRWRYPLPYLIALPKAIRTILEYEVTRQRLLPFMCYLYWQRELRTKLRTHAKTNPIVNEVFGAAPA